MRVKLSREHYKSAGIDGISADHFYKGFSLHKILTSIKMLNSYLISIVGTTNAEIQLFLFRQILLLHFDVSLNRDVLYLAMELFKSYRI